MKRAVFAALLVIMSASAQERIPFTDHDMLSLGPRILVKPSVLVHETISGSKTFFTVNLSNPGTESFTQVNVFSNDSYVQRATGLLSLRRNEAKNFTLSVQTENPGIFATNVEFSAHGSKDFLTLFVMSNAQGNPPTILLAEKSVNTLQSINALIVAPQGINTSSLSYGLISLEGEVLGLDRKTVLAGRELSVSISIPKEAVPGKYLFFASLNDEKFAGEIIEITTFISIQTLLILGLLLMGLGALVQAGRLRRKEKEMQSVE